MGEVILTMKGIDKSFPGVHALRGGSGAILLTMCLFPGAGSLE